MTARDPLDRDSRTAQGLPAVLNARPVPFVGGPAHGWVIMLVETTRPDLMTVQPQLPDYVEVTTGQDPPYTVRPLWPADPTRVGPSTRQAHLYVLRRDSTDFATPDAPRYEHVESAPVPPEHGGTP